MVYPNITLQLSNYTPQIIYYPEEGMSRVMTSNEENLDEMFKTIAEELELTSFLDKDLETLAAILSLADEGDERKIEELPETKSNSNFGLDKAVRKQIERLMEEREDYRQMDEKMSEEVLTELNKNQNVDILATLLETIYNLMILKTLNEASELGIGKIYLKDEVGLLRLQQKMASELSKLDLELEILYK